MKAVDLNGDGKDDVVTNSLYVASYGRSGTVLGFDNRGQLIWKYLAGLLENSYTTDKGFTVVGAGPYASMLNPSGQEVWKRSTRTSQMQTIESQEVYAADLTGDGKDDAVIGSNLGGKGSFLVIRDSSGEELASILYKGLESPYVIDSADLNGDKKQELLVGSLKYTPNTISGSNTPAYGRPTTFMVYDVSGSLLWSDGYEGAVTAVEACDIDLDGFPEVIAGSQGKAVAYTSKGKRLWEYQVDGQVNSLDCIRFEANGSLDVIAGAGRTYVIKANGEPRWAYSSGTAYSVKAFDFGGDGSPELVIGTSSLKVVDSKGQLVFRMDGTGNINSVDVGDLKGDGYGQIVFGSKDHKVRVLDGSKYAQVASADNFYLLADKAYKNNDYNLTVFYGNKAQEYYDMAGRDTDKIKAKNMVDKASRYSDGDKYYNISQYYFDRGQYAEAITFADRAVDEYKRVNDMRKLDALSEIKKNADLIPKAGSNMEAARKAFSERDWAKAAEYAALARSSYNLLRNSTMEVEAAQIINKCRAYGEFAREINESQNYVLLNNYGNATYHLELAHGAYLKLNDTVLLPQYEGVYESAQAIKQNSDVIVYGSIGVILLIFLLASAAIVLVLVYFVQKGGFQALARLLEDKSPSYGGGGLRKDNGPSKPGGLRNLRGRTGESIGDSYVKRY